MTDQNTADLKRHQDEEDRRQKYYDMADAMRRDMACDHIGVMSDADLVEAISECRLEYVRILAGACQRKLSTEAALIAVTAPASLFIEDLISQVAHIHGEDLVNKRADELEEKARDAE
jgi:hypothetical protein